ncbi:hypothetical protein I8752_36505 [Nostocaceae cyanobacterium CENA369]|uniref:Uncharacterized protein n=1 Tax=Dendronalium phyllosphericum CENA369 TaxID=1725256 RepID=A0A8J7IJ53_9NOST|nr:hypothetical protein [Dendronalium phyllosphericum]MBH8578348.1 hypothetical protein [Dendronalium phyllosphericum CENA369]
MTWQNLGTFNLNKDWLIVPFTGEVCRVRHSLNKQYDGKYLKAVVAKAFNEDGEINIYNPQRLSYRVSELELFYFPKVVVGESLGFLRLDDADVSWSISIQTYQENMFYSTVNKQPTTTAQPDADVSVASTQKSTIVPEKTDGTRRSYLISNTGASTVYFKFAPIGANLTDASVSVSATSYDFSLAPTEKYVDINFSKNAVVGICSGALSTAKVKVTEFMYS